LKNGNTFQGRNEGERNQKVMEGKFYFKKGKGRGIFFPFELSFLSPLEEKRMLRDNFDQKRTSLLQ